MYGVMIKKNLTLENIQKLFLYIFIIGIPLGVSFLNLGMYGYILISILRAYFYKDIDKSIFKNNTFTLISVLTGIMLFNSLLFFLLYSVDIQFSQRFLELFTFYLMACSLMIYYDKAINIILLRLFLGASMVPIIFSILSYLPYARAVGFTHNAVKYCFFLVTLFSVLSYLLLKIESSRYKLIGLLSVYMLLLFSNFYMNNSRALFFTLPVIVFLLFIKRINKVNFFVIFLFIISFNVVLFSPNKNSARVWEHLGIYEVKTANKILNNFEIMKTEGPSGKSKAVISLDKSIKQTNITVKVQENTAKYSNSPAQFKYVDDIFLNDSKKLELLLRTNTDLGILLNFYNGSFINEIYMRIFFTNNQFLKQEVVYSKVEYRISSFLELRNVDNYLNIRIKILDNIRAVMWTSTVELIKKHKILGVGLGKFREFVTYPKDNKYSFLYLINIFIHHDHAHNNFLNLSAESGLFAGLFYLILILFLFYKYFFVTLNTVDIDNAYKLFILIFIVQTLLGVFDFTILNGIGGHITWFSLGAIGALELQNQKSVKGPNLPLNLGIN